MGLIETPLLITFACYSLIILLIAYLSTRLTANLADYVLAGRRLSGPVTALAAGASDMGGWLLMALPGAVYVTGISIMWMPAALIVGAYCNWRFIAKRIRVYTEIAGDSLTIPEFLVNRFKDTGLALRLVTSAAIIIFFTYYSAAGFASGAYLIQHVFPQVPYMTALLIGASVIVAYTAMGGFLAVSWVDFFQGSLMFVAILVVPLVTCLAMGGWQASVQQIQLISPAHLDGMQNVKLLGVLSLFAWGFGYFGQLHINMRFMAIRSIKELPIARVICMNWMTFAMLGASATGLFGYLYYQATPLVKPEMVFILLARELFNPWLAGILISAVAAAIMNNVSAQILMSASILIEDFYHDMWRKNASDRENLWVSRIILVLIAGLSLTIAAQPSQTIFQAVGFAWSGLGSAFGPVLLFSLFWRRMTKQAAIWGILTGAGVVLTWGVLAHPSMGVLNHPDILPGFEMLPGFLSSALVIVIVSLNTPKPSQAVLDEFDHMVRAI
jgi:sodium/proline symporter